MANNQVLMVTASINLAALKPPKQAVVCHHSPRPKTKPILPALQYLSVFTGLFQGGFLGSKMGKPALELTKPILEPHLGTLCKCLNSIGEIALRKNKVGKKGLNEGIQRSECVFEVCIPENTRLDAQHSVARRPCPADPRQTIIRQPNAGLVRWRDPGEGKMILHDAQSFNRGHFLKMKAAELPPFWAAPLKEGSWAAVFCPGLRVIAAWLLSLCRMISDRQNSFGRGQTIMGNQQSFSGIKMISSHLKSFLGAVAVTAPLKDSWRAVIFCAGPEVISAELISLCQMTGPANITNHIEEMICHDDKSFHERPPARVDQ